MPRSPAAAPAQPGADEAPGAEHESVCAVVVTFRPDQPGLVTALGAIRPQVSELVVVDNATAPPGFSAVAQELSGLGGVLLRQETNIGLAAAQNAGIEWARAHGHTHVLLLDQDSVPGATMVSELVAAARELSTSRRVGAVGPRFRDDREAQDAPFVRVGFPMSHQVRCDPTGSPVECDFLISSGVLIPLGVIDDVGPMDDGLFIDNVDLDWSFRARAAGYSLFGVCTATMAHRLGDHRRPVLGGRATVVTHGPIRLYYIMRNRLDLYRRPHTPRVWIAQDVPRVVVKFLIFSVLVGPRARNVRFMVRGLADGLRGRLGPCPLASTP